MGDELSNETDTDRLLECSSLSTTNFTLIVNDEFCTSRMEFIVKKRRRKRPTI